MSSLRLIHLYKVYDDGSAKKKISASKPAVSDFCLEIEDREFIVLVGPSGCGKSTTLRMVAGLETITSGELYIENRLVNEVEPKDRDIAMVFQNYALYPHMTVYNNMAFGLKLKKIVDIKKDKYGNCRLNKKGQKISIKRHYTKTEINDKVMAAADILEITEYLHRKPKALSGGQRQRVALGRAIVRNPKVFLLDEPLSNLDAKLRATMRSEITKLHDKLQTTFIYVTHDQVEAMTMGTRIVVMKDGFIQQVGTPYEVFNTPSNLFVAGFIGTPQMNFLDGNLRIKHNKPIVIIRNTEIEISENKVAFNIEEGMSVKVGFRPEYTHICNENDKGALNGIVDTCEMMGSEMHFYINLGNDAKIILRTPAMEYNCGKIRQYKQGEKIYFNFDSHMCNLFDAQTEKNLMLKDAEPYVDTHFGT